MKKTRLKSKVFSLERLKTEFLFPRPQGIGLSVVGWGENELSSVPKPGWPSECLCQISAS